MSAKIIKISHINPERKKIGQVIKILKKGGVVVFPTDTVYGLGASIFFPRAIERIYRLKGRTKDKPLIILIGWKKDIAKFAKSVSCEVKRLVRKFWPGALTLLVSGKNGKKIGLRMPRNRISLRLIRGVGPLATTSANLSGEKESVTLEGIAEEILRGVDLAIDGGRCSLGRVSTILDVTEYPFRIIREGYITGKELREFMEAK